MFLDNPVTRVNRISDAQSIEILDNTALKRNFDTISGECNDMQTRMVHLEERMKAVEGFLLFVGKNHPHVVDEYATVEAAKVRVGAVSPPPTPEVKLDMKSLYGLAIINPFPKWPSGV